MNRRTMVLLATFTLAVPLAGAVCFAGPNDDALTSSVETQSLITPGTAKATQATAALDHAAKLDDLNAQTYQWGTHSSAGTYYHQKAGECKALAADLRGNRPITDSDFHHALDTSEAIRFTH